MNYNYLITGSILAAIGVAFGALGAHWLKENINMTDIQNFETAVRYQMYHAFAILLLAALSGRFKTRLFEYAFHAFWVGTLFFSGSIYLLATREITGFYWPWLGPITPIGGIFFITGWILLAVSGYKASYDVEEE